VQAFVPMHLYLKFNVLTPPILFSKPTSSTIEVQHASAIMALGEANHELEHLIMAMPVV